VPPGKSENLAQWPWY